MATVVTASHASRTLATPATSPANQSSSSAAAALFGFHPQPLSPIRQSGCRIRRKAVSPHSDFTSSSAQFASVFASRARGSVIRADLRARRGDVRARATGREVVTAGVAAAGLDKSARAAEFERLPGCRRYVYHVEGGGQVTAYVAERNGMFDVLLDVATGDMRCVEELPMCIHWGIFRSDRSSWFVLDPSQTPPGTVFVRGSTEAMRTVLQDDRTPGRKSLVLSFDGQLAPFSLNLVLFQPYAPGKAESSDDGVWLRSTRQMDLCVPIGMGMGSPAPLGATTLADGSVNFALYSRHAGGVSLCLYLPDAAEPTLEIDLEPSAHRTGDVWHVSIDAADVSSFTRYGYRCKGDPAWKDGHRFLDRSVLLDPYAKLLAGHVDGQEDFPSPAPALGVIPNLETTGKFFWQDDILPSIPSEQLLVYRLNVGAFTADASSGVREEHRGTFLGVVEKAEHLQRMGVNAVLLQPIAAFDETQGPYFPLNFFSPHPDLGPGCDGVSASDSLKHMVRELHGRGMEVLLEFVVSHTAESSDEHPKPISFRGVENRAYYITDAFGKQVVPDFGAPNAFNCNNAPAAALIQDSLRHWVTEYHIDGFSLVNAAALLSSPSSSPGAPPLTRPLLVESLAFDPVLAGVKLLADTAMPTLAAYKKLAFPHWQRWQEMNSTFCLDMRRFVSGRPGQISNLATRLCGSGDLFSAGRSPSFSFNFVTNFQGLTLADLVRYSDESEASWNCGVEGASDNDIITSTRSRQVRNLLSTLFLSQGVPVLTAGDEYGHTKEGLMSADYSNSPFLWSSLEAPLGRQLVRFVASLANFRRRRSLIMQRPAFFFAGDISWHGVWANQPDWGNAECSFLACTIHSGGIESAAQEAAKDKKVPVAAATPAAATPAEAVADVYAAFNAHSYGVTVELPSPPVGMTWHRILDTSMDDPEDITEFPSDLPAAAGLAASTKLPSSPYSMGPFSTLVLEARTSPPVALISQPLAPSA